MLKAAVLKMSRRWTLLVVLLTTGAHLTQGQGGNNDPNYRNDEYWVDRLADCNSEQEHLLRNNEVVIRGPNANPENQRAPLSCTIRLKTENNFEKTVLKINIDVMIIKESQVTFSIYDGGPGQSQLDSYDVNKGKGQAELITTGNSVTFVFQRRDSRTSLYNIEVRVSALVVGRKPGYENNFGKDYGYFNRQVPNVAIYATVGAIFILVVIVIIIVGIVCHRKHKGLDQKSESYKLSYINTNIGGLKSQSRGPVSDTSTHKWVNTSRENLRRDQRRHQSRHSDDDSVFTADSYPEKKRYNPDHESRSRSHRDRSDRHRPDSYRNDSFIRADDDHPQETFIQREMSPRVKQRGKKYKEPEEKEDDQFDSQEEELSEEEEEKEELTETEEEAEEGEEEDEEDEAVEAGGPPQYVPEHPPTRAGQPPMAGVPQPLSYPGGPGQMPVDPRQMPGPQPHSFPGDPGQMPAGPYGPRFMIYPGQPRPQFMPVAPGPGQFQPIHAPPRAMAPPAYPGHQPPKPYEAKPSDPPIYSYLVQRGYNPVDGRDSPVSVSTNASGHSDTRLIQPGPDDHDMSSHNLGTGVEYMRR